MVNFNSFFLFTLEKTNRKKETFLSFFRDLKVIWATRGRMAVVEPR